MGVDWARSDSGKFLDVVLYRGQEEGEQSKIRFYADEQTKLGL